MYETYFLSVPMDAFVFINVGSLTVQMTRYRSEAKVCLVTFYICNIAPNAM